MFTCTQRATRALTGQRKAGRSTSGEYSIGGRPIGSSSGSCRAASGRALVDEASVDVSLVDLEVANARRRQPQDVLAEHRQVGQFALLQRSLLVFLGRRVGAVVGVHTERLEHREPL